MQLRPEITGEKRVKLLFQQGPFFTGADLLIAFTGFTLGRTSAPASLQWNAVAAGLGLSAIRVWGGAAEPFCDPISAMICEEMPCHPQNGIVALFVVGSVLLHDSFGNLPGRKAPAPMFSRKQ
ncbi:MAG: hypothetical protein ACLR0N_10275 [Bilophila wadsworthia]